MHRAGNEILPTMRGIEPASWTEALDSVAVEESNGGARSGRPQGETTA